MDKNTPPELLQCENCAFICSNRTKKEPQLCSRYTCHLAPILIARKVCTVTGPMFGEHWHEQLQLLYFKSGSVAIHCNGRTYDLAAGDVLVINGNEIHYGTNTSEKTLYYIIKIDVQDLFRRLQTQEQLPYVTQLLKNQLLFQSKIPSDRLLNQTIEHILDECQQQTIGYELAVQASTYSLLVYLMRRHQRQSRRNAKASFSPSIDQLRPALRHLDQNYSEAISLEDLAGLANMSPQHFCRLFKKLTGRRPMDYINLLRINKAAALLPDGGRNVSEVAAAVGFSDANYFSRVFKKYQAVSPTEFQQRCAAAGD